MVRLVLNELNESSTYSTLRISVPIPHQAENYLFCVFQNLPKFVPLQTPYADAVSSFLTQK